MMARRVMAGRGGFNPKALFSANEQGVWYDPSDFSTLFQDAAGTTPVTAVEQPVGLMLDKSKGLVLGPELVTNGDFSNGTTGWSSDLSSLSVSSNELAVTNTGSVYGKGTQAITTVVGKTYKILCTARASTASPIYLQVKNNITDGTNVFSADASSTTKTVIGGVFVAQSTTQYICLTNNNQSGGVGYYSSVSLKELPGNYAFQTTSTAYRPTLKQDAGGNYYLLFDGTNDYLVTGPINFTSTDKMTVFAGVRKLSDATNARIIAELSATTESNNGSFSLQGPNAAGAATYLWQSKGTALTDAQATDRTAPITNILTGLGDIAGDSAILRVNGAQAASSTADQGTGNFGNYPLYIGARGGSSLYLNGRLYSLIVRGAQSSANLITATERYVARKTGVTL